MAPLERDAVAALVRDMIADGTLKPGGAVPSGAALATETGYSRITCRLALAASQAARISPMEPPRGVPVSNPPRLRDFPGFQRPRSLPFAPADRRLWPAVAEP